MQRITVTQTETKTFDKKDGSGQGTSYILTDEKGKKYSTFESILSDCKGAVLDIDTKENKGFTNITKYVIIEPATKQATTNIDTIKAEIIANARNTALLAAVESAKIYENMKPEDVLTCASKYAKWLIKGEKEVS